MFLVFFFVVNFRYMSNNTWHIVWYVFIIIIIIIIIIITIIIIIIIIIIVFIFINSIIQVSLR